MAKDTTQFIIDFQRNQKQKTITFDDLEGATPLVKNKDGSYSKDLFHAKLGDFKDAVEITKEFRKGDGEPALRVNDKDFVLPPPEHSIPEYVRKKYEEGQLVFTKAAYGMAIATGKMSVKEGLEKGNSEYLQQLKEIGKLEDVTLWTEPLKTLLGGTAKLAPFMISSVIEAAKHAVALGSVAAVTTVLSGGGTAPLVPAAISAGGTYGVIKNSLDIEGMNLYFDLLERGVSDEIALPAAISAGIAIGVVELFQLRLFGAGFKTIVGDAMLSKIGKSALFNMASLWTKNLGIQLSQEAIQESIDLSTKTFIGMLTKNPNVTPSNEEIIEQFKELFSQETVAGFGVLGAPSAVAIGVQTKLRTRQEAFTLAREQLIKKLGKIKKVVQEQKPETEIAFPVTEETVKAEVKSYVEKEGSTFKDGQDLIGTTNIAVSIFPDKDIGVIITGKLSEEQMTKELAKFREKHKEILKDPNVAVGTFFDAEENKTYIDIAAIIPKEQKEKAIQFGKDFNQRSVFDLEELKTIDTEGTGEAVAKLPSIKERLALLKEIVSERKVEKVKPRVQVITPELKEEKKRADRVTWAVHVQEKTKAFARGIKAGKRVGRKEIRAIQDEIAKVIKASNVSDVVKRDTLSFMRTVQTERQFQKAIPKLLKRLDMATETFKKRVVIAKLKHAIKKIKKTKNIAIDFINQIQDLISEVDLVKRRQKTINRLQNTLGFIKKQIESEEVVQVPKSVIKTLETLNKKKVENLTSADLESLLSQINLLAKLGKLKLELLEKQKERTKQKRLKEILEDGKPLEERPEKRVTGIREQLNNVDQIKNKFNRAINNLKRKNIAIMPMDVVFDLMSKKGSYQGAVLKIVKQTIDKKYNSYLEHRSLITNKLDTLNKDLKFDEENYKAVLAWAQLQQEGGREKLIASGYTEQKISEFENEGLTRKEETLHNFMTQEFEKIKPSIAGVMLSVYNKDFAEVKNYFPMMTDFEAMSNFEIKDRFGSDVKILEGLITKKSIRQDVKAGFTITRKGGKVPIRLDARDVFMRHIDNATYLIHLGKDIKELGELVSTNEYRQAVGNLGQEISKDWLDLLARRGGQEGQRSNWFDGLRRNVGWAVLGYKLSSALIQPTALLDGAALIGRYAFKGAKNVALSPEWRSFLKNNFTEVQARIADDPAYAEFMQEKFGKGKIGKVRQGAFWPLRKLDGITASAIAAGAYEKTVIEKGGIVDFANPDKDAIMKAELLVRRSQASGQFKDAPSALTQGTFTGSVKADRLIFQFQSFLLNRWSLIQHDFIYNGIHLKQTQESLNIVTWLIIAHIAEVVIRRGAEEIIAAATGTGDDLEDFKDIVLQKVVLEMLRTVPFLGQIIGSLMYGSTPVPIISLVEQGIRRANFAVRSKDDKKKFKNTISAVLILAGVIGGIPGVIQVDQIVRRIWGTSKKKKKDMRKRKKHIF